MSDVKYFKRFFNYIVRPTKIYLNTGSLALTKMFKVLTRDWYKRVISQRFGCFIAGTVFGAYSRKTEDYYRKAQTVSLVKYD